MPELSATNLVSPEMPQPMHGQHLARDHLISPSGWTMCSVQARKTFCLTVAVVGLGTTTVTTMKMLVLSVKVCVCVCVCVLAHSPACVCF